MRSTGPSSRPRGSARLERIECLTTVIVTTGRKIVNFVTIDCFGAAPGRNRMVRHKSFDCIHLWHSRNARSVGGQLGNLHYPPPTDCGASVLRKARHAAPACVFGLPVLIFAIEFGWPVIRNR